MSENFVQLDRNELSVLITALNNLSHHDESVIEESTSVSISDLYSKIYHSWESLKND
jgi:hypothetical protein